ncbi:unnamed protein product, partial [Brenthis ino]
MFSSSSEVKEPPIRIFYNNISSSSESFEEIPSIPPSENPKMLLYQQGLYDPGSGEICTKYVTMSDSTVFRHAYYNYPGIKDPGIKEALLEPEPRKIYSLDGQELYLDLCEEMKVSPVRSFLRGLLGEVIDLKYYGVNPNNVRAMSMALTYNRYVRRLDLTSNFLNDDACYHLGQMLGENMALQEVILSGCRIQEEGLRRLVVFLTARSLDLLDLSRNEIGDNGFEHLAGQLVKGAVIKRLGKLAATAIANTLEKAKGLHTLNLSYNPLTADGAFIIVNKLRNNSIKLINLLMDNVEVNKEFVKECKEVLQLRFRKNCKITYGDVKHNYTLSVPDIREILLKRIDFLTARASKKNQLDIAIYFLQKKKMFDNIQPREILRDLKIAGTPVDEDLVLGLTDTFPGPKLDKGGKTLDLAGVVEMVNRMWPDRKPPPTPEPEPRVISKKGGKKK